VRLASVAAAVVVAGAGCVAVHDARWAEPVQNTSASVDVDAIVAAGDALWAERAIAGSSRVRSRNGRKPRRRT